MTDSISQLDLSICINLLTNHFFEQYAGIIIALNYTEVMNSTTEEELSWYG